MLACIHRNDHVAKAYVVRLFVHLKVDIKSGVLGDFGAILIAKFVFDAVYVNKKWPKSQIERL